MKLPVKFRRSSLLTKLVVLVVVISSAVILVSQQAQIRANESKARELEQEISRQRVEHFLPLDDPGGAVQTENVFRANTLQLLFDSADSAVPVYDAVLTIEPAQPSKPGGGNRGKIEPLHVLGKENLII